MRLWWFCLRWALGGDIADLLSVTHPLPDDVQFFAAALSMPTEPVDSTLAFGAQRQGLFLTPTAAVFHAIERPASADGRKVAGTLVEWSVARQDVQAIESAADAPCLIVVTPTAQLRACLDAVAHHRDEVLAAARAWVPKPGVSPETKRPG